MEVVSNYLLSNSNNKSDDTAATSEYNDSSPFVLCCMCGASIKANDANMCAACVQSKFDITANLAKQCTIFQCRGCERYQRDTVGWVNCEPESKELLAFCLRKIIGLKYLKLVDAVFIWTEPHSRRLKVKVKVQGTIMNNVILQQSQTIEFIVAHRMCADCHRMAAKLTWNAVVQLRQKDVGHKRTFLFLEQLILKHKAHESTLNVATEPDGVDFFFAKKNEAVKFLDFLESVVPIKSKMAKKIISADLKSNVATFNFSYAVDIVPICKDDVLVLPKPVADKLGGITRLLVCTQVFNVVRLIDPLTCQMCELSADRYWANPFRVSMTCDNLVEFICLDVKLVEMKYKNSNNNSTDDNQNDSDEDSDVEDNDNDDEEQNNENEEEEEDRNEINDNSKSAMNKTDNDNEFSGINKKKRRRSTRQKLNHSNAGRKNTLSRRHQLCEVEVARSKDLGVNDTRYTVLSHLGFVLKPGDHVLGYDFVNANLRSDDDKKGIEFPDVILIRKHYPKWRSRDRERNWTMKSIVREAPDTPGLGVGVLPGAKSSLIISSENNNTSNKNEKKLKGRQAIEAELMEKRDYELFLRDIEEDEEMRSKINLYKKKDNINTKRKNVNSASINNVNKVVDANADQEEVEDDIPQIPLEELLQDLNINGDDNDDDDVSLPEIVDNANLNKKFLNEEIFNAKEEENDDL